jgi:excisionase family DNA binding protein
MAHQTENHPALLLLDLLLREVRDIVRMEFAAIRTDLEGHQIEVNRPMRKRFYTLKETAVELNLSQATVRRLIKRDLLRSSKATRHIQIPKEQIDKFVRTTV